MLAISSSRRCLKFYVVCLALLVPTALIHQAYQLWRAQRDLYCSYRYNHCTVFDRDKMCKNTNTTGMHPILNLYSN